VFDPIVPRLARTRRVTALNLPGFGASTPAGPRIEDYADRVADLFAVLPLASGADVVAMSFGGFVATALAARHGARIRRLALVDTAAAFPDAAKAPLRGMAERAVASGMDAVVDTAVRRMFSEAFIAARPDVIERQAAILAARGRRRSRPPAGPWPTSTSGPPSRPSPAPPWSWSAPSTSPPRPRWPGSSRPGSAAPPWSRSRRARTARPSRSRPSCWPRWSPFSTPPSHVRMRP
jgi:pimeloyl-ACP methyl ester carboxylesterase